MEIGGRWLVYPIIQTHPKGDVSIYHIYPVRVVIRAPKICLLVDDDPDDQEVFLTALSDVSSTVLCLIAPDGDRALEILNDKETIPHYIFLDLNMPRMNGFEFLAAIKKNNVLKDIPVIVYSTTSHHTQIDRVKKLGATDFFTKTYKYDELCNLLKKYFGD